MAGSFFEEKSFFKMLELTFSSKLESSLTLSLLLKLSKKIGALICSMKFLSPEVTLYLYQFTSLVWNTVIMSGLALLAAT